MAGTYKPVVFNEGAPLDPQKLNELQTNITNLVADVGSLKNSTTDATYILLTDAGTYMTDPLKAGTPDRYEVPYSASFSGVPRIVASIGSVTSKDEIVTISIEAEASSPKILVWTNKSRAAVRVNWIAFEKK